MSAILDHRAVRLRAAAAVAMAAAMIVLSGCASLPKSQDDADKRDPLESINRVTYKFNDTVDKAILQPVARAYNKVLPEPARNCVGNVFGNVADVWTAANEALQGKGHDAGSDVCRVAVNTTVGVLGCFDVASSMNLQKHNEDFGQTLGVWGFDAGPYIVLPILGPSDLRDALAELVDFKGDLIGHISNVPTRNSLQALRLVDRRASLLATGRLLQGASLDEYVFVRDAYLARRRSQIYDGNPPDDGSFGPGSDSKSGTDPAFAPDATDVPYKDPNAPAPAPAADAPK